MTAGFEPTRMILTACQTSSVPLQSVPNVALSSPLVRGRERGGGLAQGLGIRGGGGVQAGCIDCQKKRPMAEHMRRTCAVPCAPLPGPRDMPASPVCCLSGLPSDPGVCGHRPGHCASVCASATPTLSPAVVPMWVPERSLCPGAPRVHGNSRVYKRVRGQGRRFCGGGGGAGPRALLEGEGGHWGSRRAAAERSRGM